MVTKSIVAFDFDGVVADSVTTQIKIALEIAKSMNLNVNNLNVDEVKDLVTNEGYLAVLKKMKFPVLKIPLLLSKIKSEQGARINQIKIVDNIEKVLNTLSLDRKLFILTGNREDYILPFLKRYDLTKYFKGIYSDKNNEGKEIVFNNFYNDNANIIKNGYYIGDEVADIINSRKIGLKCIASSWGITSRVLLEKNNPFAIAKNPMDILEFIK